MLPVLWARQVLPVALEHQEQLELLELQEELVLLVALEHQDLMALPDLQGPPVPQELLVPLEQQVRKVSAVLLDRRVEPVLAVLLELQVLLA